MSLRAMNIFPKIGTLMNNDVFNHCSEFLEKNLCTQCEFQFYITVQYSYICIQPLNVNFEKLF